MHRVDLQDERNRIPFRLLCLHAEAIGDAPFLLSDEQRYSYGRANAIVNAYAHGLRKLGMAEDVAQAILFLLGPGANHITGIDILVDGGMSNNLMPATGGGTGQKASQ